MEKMAEVTKEYRVDALHLFRNSTLSDVTATDEIRKAFFAGSRSALNPRSDGASFEWKQYCERLAVVDKEQENK